MTELQRLYNTDRVRAAAKRTLPGVLFDYVDGDAEDGRTRRANRAAFGRWSLRQQVPTTAGVKADLSVEVVGRTLELPIIVAPCGMAAMMHPDGPIGATRAAHAKGTLAVLSTVAGTKPADLAAAVEDPGWFQLYAPKGREQAEELIAEAADNGFGALVITTDTAVLGRRERDMAHGVTMPISLSAPVVAKLAWEFASKPTWVARFVRQQIEKKRAPESTARGMSPFEMAASPVTWDDIAWIRELWNGPLILKGLSDPEDARRARDVGAQAVVVSNHGGRQLDGAPASLDALVDVVDAVGGDIDVIMDGGVRRGTDVLKALSLGACAVQIGRPWLFGLAVAGQAGVEHVLSLFERELINALTLLDVTAVRDLDRSNVLPAP
jgi:isopentenyl diphosphate isomerase/L-lactate dehydrogenase-like FMN-dependent dehydrogenase